jgi:hypothetical protein
MNQINIKETQEHQAAMRMLEAAHVKLRQVEVGDLKYDQTP